MKWYFPSHGRSPRENTCLYGEVSTERNKYSRQATGLEKHVGDSPTSTWGLSPAHFSHQEQSCCSGALTIWILYEMPRLVKQDDEPPKSGPKCTVISVLLSNTSKISRIAQENAVF